MSMHILTNEALHNVSLIIREMRKKDLPAVMAIENQCFAEPWPKQVFLKSMKMQNRSICLVATLEERVVGFIVAWYIPPYLEYEGEIHIHNIAVAPMRRRTGIGKCLLREVVSLGVSAHRGRCVVTLEVRESNKGAQEFYQVLGFTVIGNRPRYYKDEGALLMEAGTDTILMQTKE